MTLKELYKSKIEKCLKESSHSIKNLKDNKYINKPKWSEHSFYEAVMELLNENAIAILGYDFPDHIPDKDRRQSFKQDWVILDWIKSEQIQILALLNQMDSNDISKRESAKTKLKNTFKKKFEQYQKQDRDFYDNVRAKVVSLPLNEGIKCAEDDLDRSLNLYIGPSHSPFVSNLDRVFMGAFQKEYDPRHSHRAYSVIITGLKKEIKMHKEQFNKYPNSVLWQLKGLTLDEFNKISKFDQKEKNIIIGDETRKFTLYNAETSYTSEQYLNELNISEPITKSLDETNRIFHRILFFVNTHENYKFLKQTFALALSDEQDSMEFFKLFMNYTTPPLKKFKNVLGIKDDIAVNYNNKWVDEPDLAM